jgi:hypothetical protein
MLQLTAAEFAVQPERTVIAERVRGEFREMPGLTLTLAQARRLWSLDSSTCRDVLAQLVEAGFLSRKADGSYGRASDLVVHSLRMAKAGIDFIEIDQPRRIPIDG